jgi:hypothetical protein
MRFSRESFSNEIDSQSAKHDKQKNSVARGMIDVIGWQILGSLRESSSGVLMVAIQQLNCSSL